MLDDLPFYLSRLHYGFRRLVKRSLSDSSVNQHFRPGMGSIYFALCEEDDYIIKSLVERLKIPNGTLTGLLTTMEQQGLVKRHRCPDDGRAFRIRLTPLGRSVEPQMRERHRQATAQLQKGLKRAEVRELKRLISIILTSMD